jgi:rubrerythrin
MDLEGPVKEIALAYAGLHTSAARNRLHAARLKKDGQKPAAELLTAVADAEEVQARRALMHLRGKIVDSQAHLAELEQTKYTAHSKRFPKISSMLESDGKSTAAEAFEQFGEVAKNHYDLLVAVREADTAAEHYVCQVCGYIAVREPPPKCPVCGAVTGKFKKSS